MPLGQGDLLERRGEIEAPPSKRRYFSVISAFSVKMVADRHRHANGNRCRLSCISWAVALISCLV